MKPYKRLLSIAAAAVTVMTSAACTINPVTGERQLALISAQDEVAIGTQQYLPSQQMQGGEYLRDPGLSNYVRTVGVRLATVSDRALPYEFVIINSSVPNAWALPGGKIAINRGLLIELNSEAELAAVLAHEIVHAAARHGAQSMQRGMLLEGAIAIATAAGGDEDYSGLVVGAASVGAQLIHTRHGRDAELQSDTYGMRYMSLAGYDPRAAISLQQTFVRLSENRDSGGWLAGMFASHPPSAERVAANEQTALSLPQTGTIGREEFLSATTNLRRDASAYEALDSAREALAEGDLALARQQADVAQRDIPDEALVEALIGDIEMAADRPQRAVPRYDAALDRNSQFFYFHVAKGDAHLALDQFVQAEGSYQASLELLPTADAYLGLGRVAEARGNVALAIENYGQAAESSGQAGVDARAALIRLDLPQNPQRYLSLESGLDTNGRLIVVIGNPTDVEVGSIELTVSYIDAGRARLARRILEEPLPAGSRRRYETGFGPFASSAAFEVAIISASVAGNP